MVATVLPPHVTDAEWEVMRVVWANKKVTSKEVIAILEDKMNWKQATIRTLLGRLVEKDALSTEQEGKKYIYSAKIEENETIKDYTNDVFSRICNKEVGYVIEGLIEDHILSFDDIRRLEKALEMKKKSAVEEVSCHCAPGQCECNMKHHGMKMRGME